MWGAHSDERAGLSFTIAAGLRQCSHFRVRVPWDSRSFYCLRFETSFLVASYDSQGYGEGIRPRHHMGFTDTVKVKVTLRPTSGGGEHPLQELSGPQRSVDDEEK
jgi:hypothetical protein